MLYFLSDFDEFGLQTKMQAKKQPWSNGLTALAKVQTAFEDKITQSIKLAEMIDMMFWA